MLPVSCLFLAIYPILFLWSNNWEEVFLNEVVLLTLIVVAFTFVIFQAFRLTLKTPQKGTLATLLFLAMFVSFDHFFYFYNPVFQYLRDTKILGITLGRYSILLPAWGLVFFLVTYLLNKSRRSFTPLLKLLTAMSLILVVSTLPPLLRSLYTQYSTQDTDYLKVTTLLAKGTSTVGYLPNIYYIILDAHARHDVLKNLYGYDNTDFIEKLKDSGFYVADESCCNFPTTATSIPSSLTSTYPTINNNYSPYGYLNSSTFIKFFKNQGYTFINVGNSSVAFSRHSKLADIEPLATWTNIFSLDLNELYFCSMFLNKTYFGPFYQFYKQKLETVPDLGYDPRSILEGKRTFDQLKCLKNLSTNQQKPFFAFCHILCPHEPFVLNKDGGLLKNPKKYSGFVYPTMETDDFLALEKVIVEQTQGLAIHVIDTIETILKSSEKPPIVILQSDHGPLRLIQWSNNSKDQRGFHLNEATPHKELRRSCLKERMSILNAYHFPHGGTNELYSSITPVNSLRVLCNHYFQTKLAMLPEKCHWFASEENKFGVSSQKWYAPRYINQGKLVSPSLNKR